MKLFVFTSFLVVILFANSVLARGRLVAIADDWPLAGNFDKTGNDGAQLLSSSMGWLTENSNKNILFDGEYYNHFIYSPLTTTVNFLQSQGYSITISSPSTWDAAIMSQYGAIIWVVSDTGMGQKLVDYSNSGGNILYIGGVQDTTVDENILLNSFKIQGGSLMNGDGWQTVTSFYAHPCVAGVTSIISGGPSDLQTQVGFNGTLVSAQSGRNYIFAVPEPCTLLLLGVGGLLIRYRK